MKRKYQKELLLICFISILLLSFTSCVTSIENTPPILVGVVEDVSIPKGDSLTLGLSYVIAYEQGNNNTKLYLHAGENYTFSGTTVKPDSNFVGDLFIPLQLYNDFGYSNYDTLILSVVQKVVILPLYNGSWWMYRDSLRGADSATTSQLTVSSESVSITIDSLISKQAYVLSWENLAEIDLSYLVNNEEDGLYQYAVLSPSDTIIYQQLQHMYPCSLGASWEYTPIKFNATDNLLFWDSTVTITCTDTLVYVSVPAGVFPCREYTYQYTLRSASPAVTPLSFNPFAEKVEKRSNTITEKFYFSEGVGYVKNITYNGNVIIWTKELSDYFVEEAGIL